MLSIMDNNINQISLCASRREIAYLSPQTISQADILLENSLLAGSALLGSSVETTGQVNDGFYDGDDLISSSNYWED